MKTTENRYLAYNYLTGEVIVSDSRKALNRDVATVNHNDVGYMKRTNDKRAIYLTHGWLFSFKSIVPGRLTYLE